MHIQRQVTDRKTAWLVNISAPASVTTAAAAADVWCGLYVLQEVAAQLHQLLSGTQVSTAAAEGQAGSPTGSTGTDCRYSINSPPQIPVALLLKGSGPHPVDLSNGRCGVWRGCIPWEWPLASSLHGKCGWPICTERRWHERQHL